MCAVCRVCLGQNTDPRAIKVKQFDPVVPPVAEDKERAALGILPQAFLRGGPQTVEVGTQVAGRRGHEHFQMRLEAQHGGGAAKACRRRAAKAIELASVRRM